MLQGPKRTVVVSENIEEGADPNDVYSWATKDGLQTKSKLLLDYSTQQNKKQAFTFARQSANQIQRRQTKGQFDIQI